MAIAGLVILIAYVFSALSPPSTCDNSFGPCLATYGGGAASGGSLLAAAVLGGSLWLAAGVAAWRLRRRFTRLFFGFVALYVAALAILWEVSPLIWGPRHHI